MQQLNLFGDYDEIPEALTYEQKITRAMDIIRLASQMSEEYYKKPLIVCYSGGKDSEVLLELTLLSHVDFEVLNSHTTVDPPPVVYHIRKRFKELEELGYKCTIKMPTYKGKPTTMWKLMEDKAYPCSRIHRFCCDVLKESATPNRMCALGVRAAESNARKGRDIFSVRGGGGYEGISKLLLRTHKRSLCRVA